MSDPVQAGGETTNGDMAPPVDTQPTDTRPEWLPEKFKTPEALVESYNHLEQKLMTKTDDLKTSLLSEINTQQMEGVPDAPDGYELPEAWNVEGAKEQPIWSTFTEWAHERKLRQDDFEELVQFYATALTPDLEAEKQALGENADQRLDALGNWIGANVPQQYHNALIGMMNRHENIEAMEAIMKLTVPQNLPKSTETSTTSSNEPISEAEAMRLMASPEYMDPLARNPEVVKQVDAYFQSKYSGQTG